MGKTKFAVFVVSSFIALLLVFTAVIASIAHGSLRQSIMIAVSVIACSIVPGYALSYPIFPDYRQTLRILVAVPLSIATLPLIVYLGNIVLHLTIDRMLVLSSIFLILLFSILCAYLQRALSRRSLPPGGIPR